MTIIDNFRNLKKNKQGKKAQKNLLSGCEQFFWDRGEYQTYNVEKKIF